MPLSRCQISSQGIRYSWSETCNKEALLNLCHSSLWNVVDTIFGVTKRRFQILESLAEFTIQVQVKIVLAVTGLHHIIQSHRTPGDTIRVGTVQGNSVDQTKIRHQS